MAQNPVVEQAKQGNVNAIASLMNRLLKSQAMLANVEREGDRLEILIESDMRSLDDEVRIPKRQILVGMLKKWFVTLEVQNVSSIIISWQQTGFDEPAWTEEIFLVEPEERDINKNDEIEGLSELPRLPPLPVLPTRTTSDRVSSENNLAAAPDLDEMFGEANKISSSGNLSSENLKELQDPELLFLDDAPSISDPDRMSNNFQPETATSSNRSSWQNLSKTPSFVIQLIQYCVVCAIVILTLRGIHAAFGNSKVPKATSILPQTILL